MAYDEILSDGRALAKLHKLVVVKVPLTADGLRAVRTLKKERARTNVPLCFSASQALLAAKAGAEYISPFVGRLDDASQEGIEVGKQIVTIYDNYGLDTEVLSANGRSPLHVLQAALAGSHCATMPLKVIEHLFHHPLTDIGLAEFLDDNTKAIGKAR